tara:strand:- start:2811 stop:2951 length:141 start_codon:yes stop_codon:yes gene_type:complete
MFKFMFGVFIGYVFFEFNLLPEMLDLFVDSGAVDKTIESLEGLKNE